MILIRVEDQPKFGQGHRSRAIALAQACKRNLVSYCILCGDEGWNKELASLQINSRMLDDVSGEETEIWLIQEALVSLESKKIILDGFRFGKNFVEQLNSFGNKVALIDDTGDIPKKAGFCVLNPNIYATDDLYKDWKIKSYTGAKYILLREEFIVQPVSEKTQNVISIALGVSANAELINMLTEGISRLGFEVQFAKNLSAFEMVSLIDRSKLVICGASVTLHEVWSRGATALPIYQVIDQTRFSRYLQEKNIPFVTSIQKNNREVADDIISNVIDFEKMKLVERVSINKSGSDLFIQQLINL